MNRKDRPKPLPPPRPKSKGLIPLGWKIDPPALEPAEVPKGRVVGRGTANRTLGITAREDRLDRAAGGPVAQGAPTAKAMAAALRANRGLYAPAAHALGVSLNLVTRYCEKYQMCRIARDEARAAMKDVTEAKLFDSIEAGQPWAIQFFAKTQMRERGYGDERVVDVHVKPEPPAAPVEEIDYDDFNRRTENALRLVARIDRAQGAEPGAEADHQEDATG